MNLKCFAVLLAFLVCLISGALGLDPDNVSFKAGPTELNESLPFAWVEAMAYPKNVETGKDFFIEVNLAGKAGLVLAQLDDLEPVNLKSYDKAAWNASFKLPEKIKSGVHFLKVTIAGENGESISRTLALKVYKDVSPDDYSYKVTLKDETEFVRGRKLLKGEKVDVVYRQVYYWVRDKEGRDGWVSADSVNEPVNGIYLSAYAAYREEDYDRAIALYKRVAELDPLHANAHYWLAKSYDKIGEEDKVIENLERALQIEPTHEGASWMSGNLSRKYFKDGLAAGQKGSYEQAADLLENAAAMRPASISYLLELGRTYERMGEREKAQEVWKRVLFHDPNNQQAHALLKTDYYRLLAKEEEKAEEKVSSKVEKPPEEENLSSSSKYVQMVQINRTTKGTPVASALKSVLSMTKSLGTRIIEDGWKTSLSPHGFLVTYVCRQERLGKMEAEDFVFKVDLDSQKVTPFNKNAKLLMLRW